MVSQQYFRETLERRVNRLSDLLEMSAPTQLVGKEVALIVQAAMGYCPQEVSSAISSWLLSTVLRDAGFCANCNSKFAEESDSGDYVCPTCKDTEGAEGDSIKTYDKNTL